ncbi:MAG TPA: flagellar biosynthetic protein FliO [Noviherbaspirillum sp.]|nr:flagellar biosynthetic protein FliO [Noviherbaspirillum sp.]
MIRAVSLFAVVLLCSLPAQAAEQAAAAASAGSLVQVLLGLVVVLALMAGAAWVLKRMGMTGAGANSVARVVGGVSVGNRERVVVVEVGEQWIVVGVAPGRVNALSTMPRQEMQPAAGESDNTKNFAAWLKQTIDKRNGN